MTGGAGLATDIDYAYAVGRIRAIERKLLDKNKIDRMLDSKTPDEALKVLSEADYSHLSGEVSSAFEYESLLKNELKKVYSLLADIAPQPEVFNTFLFKNDFHNIRVLIKAEFSNKDELNLLTDSGSISLDSLKAMIRDRNFKNMPRVMKTAIEECIDSFNRIGDPQLIDIILDKAWFILMAESAKHSGMSFLIKLVDIMIDLINIKAFLRVKSLDKSWDFVDKILLSGGTINRKVFFDNLEEPLQNITSALSLTQYSAICEDGIKEYSLKGTLTRFEKLCDDYITNFLKKAKYIHLGIEPLIAYLIAKETEIKNVRIIMVGKINNISNDVIRERLRETYV